MSHVANVAAEALLGIPEDVPCDPKDGWKLLKWMPWSRAKRKAMFADAHPGSPNQGG